MDIHGDLASVQQRIAQITGRMTAAPAPLGGGAFASLVNAFMPKPAAAAAMQWPVIGDVTSGFGERKNPMGSGSEFHPGLDIAADEGAPIAAASAGRVISAGPDGGYGNLIIVDHGNGVTAERVGCAVTRPPA